MIDNINNRIKSVQATTIGYEDSHFVDKSQGKNKSDEGKIENLLSKYNSQCSVNIIESQKFSIQNYDKNIPEINVYKKLKLQLNNVFERSDFKTQLRRYGRTLAEQGLVILSAYKADDNWYLSFHTKHDCEFKHVWRDFKEIYFKTDEFDKNNHSIWIQQKFNKKNKVVQNKVIKDKNGSFKNITKFQDLNIKIIPAAFIRNNCDGTSDIKNVEWLIKKLDDYWTKIDEEFNHTRAALRIDPSSTGGGSNRKIIQLRNQGLTRELRASPFGMQTIDYAEVPQLPFNTLMTTIEWMEDKIFKFMSSIREKQIADKQQKNNLEIASFDQIAIEYYLHKKTQREEDLTYFFNKCMLQIINQENGTYYDSFGKFTFAISEFQQAKIESVKSAMVKNQNLQAQANNYKAGSEKLKKEAAKVEKESAKLEAETKMVIKAVNAPLIKPEPKQLK